MLCGLLSALWLTRTRPRVQRMAKTEERRSREEERQEEKKKKQVKALHCSHRCVRCRRPPKSVHKAAARRRRRQDNRA